MTIQKYIKTHSVLVTTITFLLIVVVVIAGRMAKSKNSSAVSSSNEKQVTLVEASSFHGDTSIVSADGVVESVSQVDLKSQVSAPLSMVNVSIGEQVFPGQILAEFQNADIRAQLDQARANLELAKGQYSVGNTSIDTTRKAVIDKIRDAYSKSNDLMNAQIAQFLYNANPNLIQLQDYITDETILSQLATRWDAAVDNLRIWATVNNKLADSSSKAEVDVALAVAQKSLATLSNFLDTLSLALGDATKNAGPDWLTTISGWKTTVSTGRSTINAAIAGLTSSGSSITTNQAQITAAEAGVKNLQAQLAKTLIVAPISGKVASLPFRVGEFVSPGQLITTIVGAGGLQVKAFASGEDLERIKPGLPVTLTGGISGTVASVAPSVNQVNKKVEVKIIIKNSAESGLVVGQSIQAKIQAVASASAVAKDAPYMLPIQNVKIIPGDAYVFTLDADNKVVANSVTLGQIKGDFVEVKTGLTDDMKIISPVYELQEGEVVKVN